MTGYEIMNHCYHETECSKCDICAQCKKFKEEMHEAEPWEMETVMEKEF